MNWKITLTATLVLAGVVLFVLYQTPLPGKPETTEPATGAKPKLRPIIRKPATDDPAIDNVAKQPVGATTEPKHTVLIPPPDQLDNSDAQVLKVIADIAPALSTWLLPKQQVRKWVLTIDLLADAELPEKYPPLNFPMAAFKVTQSDGVTRSDEKNFSRANPLIDAITAIDPQTLANYYEHWLPVLELAYREQGKPGSFDQRFHKALDNILRVKPLTGAPALKQPHVFFQYSDAATERSSDLDKFMWRLGPDNQKKIQTYVQQLKVYL